MNGHFSPPEAEADTSEPDSLTRVVEFRCLRLTCDAVGRVLGQSGSDTSLSWF